MKKQALLRGLLGLPLGIAIGYLITIFISLSTASGAYTSCAPALIKQLGSELSAVILQTILCAVLGGVFSSASVIWELENWSIFKQTGIYFIVISLTMLPVAYFAHWMEHTIAGVLIYFGIFIGISIFIWITQYLLWRNKVKQLNHKVKANR